MDGQATGDESVVDKAGVVSIEIGGAGCNVATNLAHLGLQPRLLTAMAPNSTYSEIIKAHLRSNGVDVRVLQCEGLPDAIFSAHIGQDGELLSAISSMPLDSVAFDDEYVISAMQGVRCVVIESNLSVASMQQMAQIAKSLSIPVYAAAVSEGKCIKLAALAGMLDGAFMNRLEHAYLDRHAASRGQSSLLEGHLGCPTIVSLGAEGARILNRGQETYLPLGFEPVRGQTLGAGDAMLAASLLNHIFAGMPLDEAVSQSFAFAAKLIGRSNCNTADASTVEAALHVLGDQARTDALTGLANRRAAEMALDHAAAADQVLSVLMVDIDHFKRVNDTHGHDIGDEVLQGVAKILQTAVRGSDLACRWGGEEFLCVFPGMGPDIAMTVAERIRTDIEAAYIAGVGTITVSIGAAFSPKGGQVKDAVRRADQALYRAKRSGRNRVEGCLPLAETRLAKVA